MQHIVEALVESAFVQSYNLFLVVQIVNVHLSDFHVTSEDNTED